MMEEKMKMVDMRPLIDKCFNEGCVFTFKPGGTSMLPCIKGSSDSVTIEKYEGGAKKNDIVFFVRRNGKYVMHRVIKIEGDGIWVCGDNQYYFEKINEDMIFAYVTKIVREGKERKESAIYLKTLFIRRFCIHVKDYLRRHLKKEAER
ncbi:MAG: S24/S26 family peptidase [Clostridia bacterium]|nr:S24/S26 family peptidase [Clostridia bacterium]